MNRLLTVRGVAGVLVLTVVWVGLWQDVSAANVLGGLALAVASTVLLTEPPQGRRLRIPALGRLLAVVGWDLAKSTASVGYEILTPTDHTDETIIRVDAPELTDTQRVIVTLAITLTPGTAVIDIEDDTLVVHLLHRDRIDDTIEHAHRLIALAHAAFPTPAPSREGLAS